MLGTILKLATGVNIFSLFKYLGREFLLIVSTSSSESALPRLIAKMNHAGVEKTTVGVVVPTGYSFNLDGTAIYLTMASIFIADALDKPLSIGEQVSLLLFMIIASKGAAGVTGAGLATLAGGLSSHRPELLDGVGLIVGIDRFMSEARARHQLRRQLGRDHPGRPVDRHPRPRPARPGARRARTGSTRPRWSTTTSPTPPAPEPEPSSTLADHVCTRDRRSTGGPCAASVDTRTLRPARALLSCGVRATHVATNVRASSPTVRTSTSRTQSGRNITSSHMKRRTVQPVGHQQRVAAHVLAEPLAHRRATRRTRTPPPAVAPRRPGRSGPAVGRGDDDLGLDPQARDRVADRPRHRLERVGRLAACRGADPLCLGLTPTAHAGDRAAQGRRPRRGAGRSRR